MSTRELPVDRRSRPGGGGGALCEEEAADEPGRDLRAGFWRALNARRRAKRKAEVRSPKLVGSGRQGRGEQSLSGVM